MSLLNERIKQMRITRGFTLLQVANSLGIKEATAQRYESGEIKNIKYETIEAIAELFNCSPSYLMGWSDNIMPGINNYEMSKYELKLLSYADKLNDIGQKEALKRVEELTYIPKYQKQMDYLSKETTGYKFDSTSDNPLCVAESSAYYTANAAHGIPEATKEEKNHDDDIMYDDDEWK